MPNPEALSDSSIEKQSGEMRSDRSRIQRRSTNGPTICSFAQERLWVLDQLTPGNAAYNIPGGLRLKGSLDVDLLVMCIDEIVRRHEILRVRFQYRHDQISQIVDSVGVAVETVDLSGLAPRESGEAVRDLADKEARQGFDLERGPLLRVKLLQIAPKEHVLLMTMHHIVSDGWSIGIITRELTQLYAAFREGASSPLPELKIQYQDYALWQREQLQGRALNEQLNYWRKKLEKISILELAGPQNQAAAVGTQCASLSFCLSSGMTTRLQILSRRRGLTLFMTLLAGFQVLLARYSGSTDIGLGTPISSRPSDAEQLIGCFVNTLVMRLDVSGNPQVKELLARVRQMALEAYSHCGVPFEKIVEELQPARDRNRSPVFSVLFAFQAVSPEPLDIPGLSAEVVVGDSGTAKVDLTFSLDLVRGELRGKAEYKRDLFGQDMIQQFIGCFEQLLEGMLGDDEGRVMEIPLLTPQDRELLLHSWNATSELHQDHRCIHQLFEEQVRRTPDSVAVAYGEDVLTYADLNQHANRLAHYLIGLGVKPDDRVAICVERGIDLVIGLLGILKAGGAYVPLDPAYPTERLGRVIADAASHILLCDLEGRKTLSECDIQQTAVVELNQLFRDYWKDLSSLDPDPSQLGLTSHHLAYVIYTSGSTGTPKGVMVEHAQVGRLFEATDASFGFNQEDVWCLFHSFAFDFSVWELWGALRYGGRLVIVPRDIARSSQDFYRLVCDQGVTVLNQTPSAFKGFIQAQIQEPLPHRLRYVIFGGEALEPSILKPWYDSHPDHQPQLVNMYGITETTVHVTYRPLHSSDVTRSGSPIGKRLPDLRLYLLDAYGEPVPLGAVGEIYVGGAGVARGYLNRPELTAERFLDDPFSPVPGARMYRTGDLARYLPDGDIEFLGRNDDQVKIRGFRIELGEIEARLTEHSLVREAAVVAHQPEIGEKRLVAYVVLNNDQKKQVLDQTGDNVALSGALRTYLASCLPEYMVPAAFVRLRDL